MVFSTYHVTNGRDVKKIESDSFKIRIPLVVNEGVKDPGSLGYGLYTYLVDEEHSERVPLRNFIDRMYDNDPKKYYLLLFEVDAPSDKILNLNDRMNRMSYGKFYERTYRRASTLAQQRGFHLKGRKQHVFDGVMIEMFISYLRAHGKDVPLAVMHNTYTPSKQDSKVLSDIENGTELCLQSESAIISKTEVEKVP